MELVEAPLEVWPSEGLVGALPPALGQHQRASEKALWWRLQMVADQMAPALPSEEMAHLAALWSLREQRQMASEEALH